MIELISQHSELDVAETPIILLPVHLTTVESVAFKQSCMQFLERILEKKAFPKNIIFDFRQNTFIGSSGIGSLVTVYKAARRKGIDLILKNVTPEVMMVLQLTQLDQVFTIDLSDEYPVTASH